MSVSIAPIYRDWRIYNEAIVAALRPLTPDQLALDGGPPGWPIWAVAGHTAGVRVYWLCGIVGEPGAESTPFPDAASGIGWEDDLTHPRDATELIGAFETTWRVVEDVLGRWTIDDLELPVRRESAGRLELHTRGSVLSRMLSHDAYHAGQLSLILGANGLTQVDLWPPKWTPTADAGLDLSRVS
jgi:uncharacterized damage-inducible protein DinB